MKFGLWDHVDKSDRPLNKQFDERLEFVAAADAAGFHCFHVAEHHATPLNMVPIPGVYLGAVARITKRMRLGPLGYLLPLYSPLRLIEEIAILDNLSNGRLEVGVGRGVSPFEMNYHGIDEKTGREVFQEVLEATIKGLTSDRFSYEGKHFKYKNVPMEIRPLQQPHPPIWYPSSNEGGAAYSGQNGYNFVTLGTIELAKKNVAAYKAAFAKRGSALTPSPAFPGGTAIGVNRHVVIADTDAEAVKIARPAHEKYYDSLTKLWRENQTGPTIVAASVHGIEENIKTGAAIVGSPATVLEAMRHQIKEIGLNYMTCGFFFGDMKLKDALRSMELFTKEVMPKL
jgi:alkanesulfonate monooxygenase SsuD/methylene tetrahydromethanopterin reductase-like flavin-dependent oxidoreductase (luciferase family)